MRGKKKIRFIYVQFTELKVYESIRKKKNFADECASCAHTSCSKDIENERVRVQRVRGDSIDKKKTEGEWAQFLFRYHNFFVKKRGPGKGKETMVLLLWREKTTRTKCVVSASRPPLFSRVLTVLSLRDSGGNINSIHESTQSATLLFMRLKMNRKVRKKKGT